MRIWEDLEERDPDARFIHELDDEGHLARGPRHWPNASVAEATNGVIYVEDFTAMHARNPARFPRVDHAADWRAADIAADDRYAEFEFENMGIEVLHHTCGWIIENPDTLLRTVLAAEKHLRECESPEAKR